VQDASAKARFFESYEWILEVALMPGPQHERLVPVTVATVLEAVTACRQPLEKGAFDRLSINN
jgi:hypothetical protein